jgi:hypothetical protein
MDDGNSVSRPLGIRKQEKANRDDGSDSRCESLAHILAPS